MESKFFISIILVQKASFINLPFFSKISKKPLFFLDKQSILSYNKINLKMSLIIFNFFDLDFDRRRFYEKIPLFGNFYFSNAFCL